MRNPLPPKLRSGTYCLGWGAGAATTAARVDQAWGYVGLSTAIHEVSARAAQPFIAVNCGAIPEQLLEAEFFGYRKGAFTGAHDDREGFFQAAHGGTLFLDEIGDLPLSMQSKLLRAIQERSVRPIGAMNELPVNVRILSATHRDLAAEVQAGRFRQDLFYRLNVIQIRVPPLRERSEDLPAISEAVLERIARDAGVGPSPRLSADALAHLAHYGFPGNVRELENLLHRAVALSSGELIVREDLGLPEDALVDSELVDLDVLGEEPASVAPAVALPAPLQPHGGRREPGPVAAADALPHGAPGHQRRGPRRRRAVAMAAAWDAGWWSGAVRRRSPNFGPRPPDCVIDLALLHSISLPPGVYGGDAIEQLFTNTLDWDAHPYYRRIRGLKVSAHFLVRRDGALLQFVSCDERAWHAGASQWRGRDNCNDFSIGIELEGLEGERFDDAQYDALVALLRALAQAYPIVDVAGHEHVAPGRKIDPGPGFDWARLQAALQWPQACFAARHA